MIKINETSFVSQTSINDCGIACLSMLLKSFGKNVATNDLKNEFNMGMEGVSAYDIINVAKKYGLSITGYKEYGLDKAKTPFIALTMTNDKLQHFVVVKEVKEDKIIVLDPATSKISINKSDFVKKYLGIALVPNNLNDHNYLSVFNNKKLIISILLATFIVGLLSIISSYTLSFIIKLLELKETDNKIIYACLFLIIIYLFKEIFDYYRQKVSLHFKLLIDKGITIPTINKLINLPHNFYQSNGSGELISKLNDLSYVKEMFFKLVEVIFVNVILLLFTLITVGFLSIKILIISLLLIMVMFIYNYFFVKKHYYETYDMQVSNESLNGDIVDSFNGIISIKNLKKENYFLNKLSNNYELVLEKYKNISKKYQQKSFIEGIVFSLLNVIMILTLSLSNISLYQIMFVLYLLNILTESVTGITSLMPLYSDFKSSYNRIKTVFNIDSRVNDDNGIEISNIKFDKVSYEVDDKLILKDVSFNVNKGDWVMIQGDAGSGKTTLFKLLTRQIKKDANIYINNKLISNYKEGVIENNIVYVDQKTKVFNMSIKDNIFFGSNLDEKVLKASLVDKMIKDNNITYDYVVDNTNANLSGGQLQKIMIASSLACNKKIIIFDETTSQLDNKSERIILKNIKRLYNDLTIILITHRDSNKDLFNKIITLNNISKKED